MAADEASGLFGALPEHVAATERQGGRPRLRRAERGQVELRALSLDDLVPADHRVRLVRAFAEGLDLAPLYDAIRSVEGGPGHPPADETTGSDMGQLRPMNDALAAAYGRRPRQHLVDGGFTKLDDIDALAERGVAVCAPPPTPRTGRDPHAPLPGDRPAIAEWRRRMGSDDAKAIYRERAATAELVNAQALSVDRHINLPKSMGDGQLRGPLVSWLQWTVRLQRFKAGPPLRRDQRPLPIRHVACVAPARAHIVTPGGRRPCHPIPRRLLPETTVNQTDGGRSTSDHHLPGQALRRPRSV